MGFNPRLSGTKQGLYHWAITFGGYTNMLNILNILSKSIPNDALFTNFHIDLIIPFPPHISEKVDNTKQQNI